MERWNYSRADFDHSPMIVFYETTRACDLMCRHCRADAQRECDPGELSTARARRLIEQLASFPRKPLLVLTGGDPMKREDVFELVGHAVAAGLDVAMTPSATPLVTREAVRRLKDAGLHRLAVSLDGADAETHDGFRRVAGSFRRTLEIMADARECGLPLQVNTTVGKHNIHQLEDVADLLRSQGIVLWSVFFLVPTGRGESEERIAPGEYEMTFERLRRQAARQPYAIKTTEAPHYRRYLMERARGGEHAGRVGAFSGRAMNAPARPSVGTNDGKGVMFISHTGEIYPSGFLPISCGKFPLDSVVRVYRESALFRALRDSDQLSGKCGDCEFRNLCGGSRARAYAVTGDPMAAEPDCVYVPLKLRRREAVGA
jgi:radical SAM protein